MESRKRRRICNNNKYPPNKKSHLDVRFEPEDLFDLGVHVLSDEEDYEPTDIYNDHDRKIAEKFEERKILKPVPVRDIVYKRRCSDEGSSKNDFFASLPDEIIMKILQYLNDKKDLLVLSQACRRLNNLCKDEILWTRLNLTSRKLDVDAIGHILALGVRVLRLNSVIFPTPIMSADLALKMEGFKSKVQFLDLSYAFLSAEGLCLLLSKMRFLVKLSLESCSVDANVMKQVAANKGLKTLNLAMATGLDYECVEEITTNLPKLKSLNISWTNLNCADMSRLCRGLTPCMKHLDISGAQFNLNNDDLVTLMKRCVHLESLNISDCLAVSVGSFRQIINNLTGLKTLGVSRCYQIDLQCLLELKSLNELEELAAYRLVPDLRYEELTSGLPNVKVNKNPFSIIARPTVGIRRTSIWEQATTD